MANIDGGYIILARKILGSPSWKALNEAGKNVMITLIMMANHKPNKWYNKMLKREIDIQRGQLITGRKALSLESGVSERSVRTALNTLKTTNFLTIETTKMFSFITICNYDFYQNQKNYTDQVSANIPTKHRPSTDQAPTTNNNGKNVKNDKEEEILSGKKPDLEAPILYLNLKTKSKYDPKNKSNQDLVRARYNEGRTLEQFTAVIDKKAAEWLADEKMFKYLRPSTLFSRTNFENYINQPASVKSHMPEPKPDLKCDICFGKGIIPDGQQKGAQCLCVK